MEVLLSRWIVMARGTPFEGHAGNTWHLMSKDQDNL
jgi:hypothetical protein